MLARALADAVVVAHLAFIVFVAFGGFVVLRHPAVAWLHVPALAWGIYVELTSTICPLTPLENVLRRAAGAEAYAGSFVDRYVVPVVYPPGLTPGLQAAIGAGLVVLNAVLYASAWRRFRSRRASGAPTRS
jgi:hypothetical protein